MPACLARRRLLRILRLPPQLIAGPADPSFMIHSIALPLQIESQTASLASLMQQGATRLCPTASRTATDAVLSLLSTIKAAQLPPTTPRDAAARLNCSAQQLLHVLQQALVPSPSSLPQPPPTPASNRTHAAGHTAQQQHDELCELVRQLGFSSDDWQAASAALSLRTSQALQPSGATQRLEARAALSSSHSPVCSPLDSLLLAAVETSAWNLGQPSLLHTAVKQLLWLLRRLPVDAQGQLGLTAVGWAAYWQLEPLVRV